MEPIQTAPVKYQFFHYDIVFTLSVVVKPSSYGKAACAEQLIAHFFIFLMKYKKMAYLAKGRLDLCREQILGYIIETSMFLYFLWDQFKAMFVLDVFTSF